MIECVPNFSEGRDLETIHAIGEAIQSVSAVQLLDVHSDADHNRSVFTFAGEKENCQKAAFAAIRTASQHIDLRKHSGCHPRIGAADVIPFIPLAESTMKDCIETAKNLAWQVANDLALPVYLYGNAAVQDKYKKLSDIRRDGFEHLQGHIDDGTRLPDYGPLKVPNCGACVIGSRFFLVAFNIFYQSADIDKVKHIAKLIRESSGGMKNVQALGMMVSGQAQLSMNLTDYRVSSLQSVFSRAIELGKAEGISADHSELVGMVPAAAIQDVDPKAILLSNFSEKKILENAISHYPAKNC